MYGETFTAATQFVFGTIYTEWTELLGDAQALIPSRFYTQRRNS